MSKLGEGQTNLTSTDRHVTLLLKLLRNEGVVRRMIYAFMIKTYGTAFAQETYEHAAQKSKKEALPFSGKEAK